MVRAEARVRQSRELQLWLIKQQVRTVKVSAPPPRPRLPCRSDRLYCRGCVKISSSAGSCSIVHQCKSSRNARGEQQTHFRTFDEEFQTEWATVALQLTCRSLDNAFLFLLRGRATGRLRPSDGARRLLSCFLSRSTRCRLLTFLLLLWFTC